MIYYSMLSAYKFRLRAGENHHDQLARSSITYHERFEYYEEPGISNLQILQDVLRRLDTAFKNFEGRTKYQKLCFKHNLPISKPDIDMQEQHYIAQNGQDGQA
ncbi:MAG: hypothetical protein ACP5NC_01535 [Nitrososphaeria archaeon]